MGLVMELIIPPRLKDVMMILVQIHVANVGYLLSWEQH